VNNSLKHGKSDTIIVEFYGHKKNYLFQYTDYGIGFNPQFTPKGFGLSTIENRILNHKGTFEINSQENQGTVIQITLPR